MLAFVEYVKRVSAFFVVLLHILSSLNKSYPIHRMCLSRGASAHDNNDRTLHAIMPTTSPTGERCGCRGAGSEPSERHTGVPTQTCTAKYSLCQVVRFPFPPFRWGLLLGLASGSGFAPSCGSPLCLSTKVDLADWCRYVGANNTQWV